MIICEICGTTYESSTSGEYSDICQVCIDYKPAKQAKDVSPTVKKLKSALKRVLKSQVSKVLKVRECPCDIEKIISNASERWTRLNNIELEGVTSLVFEETTGSKFMIAYKKDGKIFQGYYS